VKEDVRVTFEVSPDAAERSGWKVREIARLKYVKA